MTSVFPKLSSNHTLLLLLEMIYFEENGNDLLLTQGSLPGHYSGGRALFYCHVLLQWDT